MAGKRSSSAQKRRMGQRRASARSRLLSAESVEELVARYSQITFERGTQNALRGDLNAAISQFKFRQGYATAPTLTQFRQRFDRLRAALRRVKGELPPIDRQNDLFNYIRRLGEAYAAAHGPHPGIDPRKFPSLSEFGLEDETPDFNSAQRLRELIESVEQVSRWDGGLQRRFGSEDSLVQAGENLWPYPFPRTVANRKSITCNLHRIFWAIQGPKQSPAGLFPLQRFRG